MNAFALMKNRNATSNDKIIKQTQKILHNYIIVYPPLSFSLFVYSFIFCVLCLSQLMYDSFFPFHESTKQWPRIIIKMIENMEKQCFPTNKSHPKTFNTETEKCRNVLVEKWKRKTLQIEIQKLMLGDNQ